MKNVLQARSDIYDQFHRSTAGSAHFFLVPNADAYAAYYTSMYLIQDTGGAVFSHMARDFSEDPMLAYVEFWGVLQAVVIQQDAIIEIHRVVVGSGPQIGGESPWMKLRDFRNLCAGHPANRQHGVLAPQRTFMGRSFGNYDDLMYELWDATTGKTTHPVVNLRQMINDYDVQAGGILRFVLASMRTRWP